MRLKDMRERVKSLLAYKPEAQVFADDVDRAIQDALDWAWTWRAWTFAERVMPIDVLPDLTPSSVGGSISATVLNEQRYVLFSGEVPDLRPDLENYAGPGRTWVGQYFSFDGRDYRIESFTNLGSSTVLILDEPARLEVSAASLVVTDWRMKWRTLPLPDDLQEILGLSDADFPLTAGGLGGKLPGLPMRRAEDLDLRQDLTGTAECYILDPVLEIPPAGKTTAAAVLQPGGGAVTNTYGFAIARFYELTWAFSKGGQIGALAEPVVVELTAAASNILVSFFAEDGVTPASTDAPTYEQRPYPLAFEGYKKVLFVNSNLDPVTGLRKGVPCWRRVTRRTGLTIETQSDGLPLLAGDQAASATINQPHQVNTGNPRLPRDPDGQHQRIRVYPRPADYTVGYPEYEYGPTSADAVARKLVLKQFLLRYAARPPQLAEAADSAMPVEFHMVLVHKAAAQIMRTNGDLKLASDYEVRAEDGIKRLGSRYGVRTDTNYVRGSWADEYSGREFRTDLPVTAG